MTITDSEVKRFAAFGYTILRGILTPAECRSIAHEFAVAFRSAYPNLRDRPNPAWLPGLADATPCSTALTTDDDRLWPLSRQLLGGPTLPCPPEVAWLKGHTPWHYDDPLELRGVKFLGYVLGPATGLRMLPMSHLTPHRDLVREHIPDGIPAVPVMVEPGDLVAIDLHVWHSYEVAEPRILWSPEYLALPADPIALDKKFAAVAAAGTVEGGPTDWPVWRDWLRGAPPHGPRRQAIDLLHHAGAFTHDRDRH